VVENLGEMDVSDRVDELVLETGALRVEVTLRPFSFVIRRAGRSLLRGGGAWAVDGQIRDQFLQFTEGVLASEERTPAQRAVAASVGARTERGLMLDLGLEGGRDARLAVELPTDERVSLALTADGEPLRLGLDWERRAEERLVGLGLRHHPRLDQAGRDIQLGADRRYTGPDCPPEMLAEGGIPQGDCAPVPWLLSSRGYGVWCAGDGNGTCFDLAGERISVSARARTGPLTLQIVGGRTPAARLRELCRLTGFPAQLPEWGYGFWKSRDVHEHQDDVLDDFLGFRRHRIPLDAIVIDSPWATQYNTWEFNPHQFPDAAWMISSMRAAGVRTVVWVTPWVNLDSRTGQIPPQPESERLHASPAPNYAPAAAAGHFVREEPDDADAARSGEAAGRRGGRPTGGARTASGRPSRGRAGSMSEGRPFVSQWWMGTGSPVDFTSPAAEQWWRESAKRVLELGVEGIKADDGDGYYIPDRVRLADGRTGAQAAWALGGLHRRCLQRALDEAHPGRGVLFGRSGWSGQHAYGLTWAGDQVSDFWSLRVLVVAALSAACSGISNFSHDIGGYLGYRLVQRCPPELLVRWLQFGCFTPLMHAHSRMPQEPWHYGGRVLDLYRAYVLLHEQLVPYVRAAALTAARTGLPIMRPLCLLDPDDPRGWTVGDAYGYGPALWVAPVLDDRTREREAPLPRGEWIETWSGRHVSGGGEVIVDAPVERIPVWVRAGSIVVTYPAWQVAAGLGDEPEAERSLVATLWGVPRLGQVATRLADGGRIGWRDGRWELPAGREIKVFERSL
jgi:alpha-glucosidase (family GH31 glycosyl hydrolase)